MYTKALLTDLYQLTMMQGLFFEGKHEQQCVFDRYYRTNPFQGGYTVVAGLEHLIDYVHNIQFSEDDLAYLKSTGFFQDEFLEYLKDLRFTGDIYAMPEGTVAFPQEVLLRVQTKKDEALLLETCMSMIMNHESLIATKARRVRTVAGKDNLMEFGLRRAQGKSAGVYGARSAMIGGFNGTSNVLAGAKFGMPVLGTMAHSWIMSFPDEYTAFKTYADMYPSACILLVDTYDTLKSGVPNAIRVFTEMREAGIPLTFYGIRLDSGDLAYLSKKARKMLDEAGFPDAVISASNDLDEYLIDSLKVQGCKITSWGVGTHLIASKDWPSFGGVYKLAAIQDAQSGEFIPKIKLSENSEKITNPGNKKIYRIYEKDTGKIKADLICLVDETYDENDPLVLFDPNEPWKKTKLLPGTYELRELMVHVFNHGNCIYHSPKVMDIRDYCQKELETLWEETRRLVNPHGVYVDLSQKLYDMKISLLNQMSQV